MKPANTHITLCSGTARTLIVLGTLAALLSAVACSEKPRPAVNSPIPASARLRPAVLQTAVPALRQAAAETRPPSPAKPPESKPILYRSRDYGVSFQYPWQYAFLSARAVANGDASLRPKPDGHDAQFTLARVEIPRGFYADTDYESGYFVLSLNQNLSEEECMSVLTPGKDGKVETETVNGVEFRRVESDGGGRGRAIRLRQYVTFTNGTCYELEMGVRTRNDGGLSREVDPDQVLRRLNAILRTVRIVPSLESPAAAENSTAAPAAQN